MTPVRLEPAALRSRAKHSTTEPLHSLLLLVHYIYVSVTKPTYPAFSAWLNTGSVRSLKVTGKAIMLCSMALPSKLCAALHDQSNVVQCVIARHAEVWTCQFWWKFYQELTVTMAQVQEGTAVSTQGQHYVKYKEGHADMADYLL